MNTTMTNEGVKEFLRRLSISIEIDQAYVDALPRKRFSVHYNDGMWRDWRNEHRRYIDRLLLTVDSIPAAKLRRWTEIAATRELAGLRKILLERFADVVGGHVSEDDLSTAESFFDSVIHEWGRLSRQKPELTSSQASILQWLPTVDPLQISKDPECGYAI